MRYDPNYVSLLTQSLGASSATEEKLTTELSSGLRVSRLSDDAVAASTNVLLAGAISKDSTFVSGASTDESMLQVTDSALSEVVSQVTSAISLAVSAGTGSASASNLSAISKQVSDIRDNVVSLANTSYLGNYVFSGSAGSTKPFTVKSSTTPATTTYSGDNVVRTVTTPDGQQIGVNVPGSTLFGNGLLSSLNQLVTDLGAGNATAAAADSTSLTTALTGLSTQRTSIGSALSRLTATATYASTQTANLEAQQTTLISSDPTQVATDLKTAETQHEALLGVVSAADKSDLFDYLK